MNIENVKQSLEVNIKADQATILWGQTGVGKSTIVKDLCLCAEGQGLNWKQPDCQLCEDGVPHRWHLIDLRLGQMDSGDLVGLPRASKEGDTTEWLRGSWWPTQGVEQGVCGLIFLDELNRASTPDVVQASFQLILPPHKIHTNRLPPGWRVVGACNPPNGNYQVMRLDPAYTARFCHLFIKPEKVAWMKWAKETMVATPLVDFANKTKGIFREEEMPDLKDLGVTCNPRAYTALSSLLPYLSRKQVEGFGSELFGGLIGYEVASTFVSFYLEGDCLLSGADILQDYNDEAVKSKVKTWVKEHKFEMVGSTLSSVVEELKTDQRLTKKRWDNLGAFLGDLPVELGMSVVSNLRESGFGKLADDVTKLLPKGYTPKDL